MKDYLLLLTQAMTLALVIPIQTHAAETSDPDSASYNKNPRIQSLLQQEAQNIAAEFPYRVNLFTQGQISKATAGTRFAETAKQLGTDNSGLLFFYDLVTNGMRVPHWHANANEIGTVVTGKMRITIWEGSGKPNIFTVEKNGTWIIPKARLHALENVSEGEMKFVVAYDSPIAADKDFLTAWTSLPDAVLARSVGLSEQDVAEIRKTTIDRLSKFDPGASIVKEDESSTLSSSFKTVKPIFESAHGSISRIDSRVNPLMDKMALQRTVMKPGALRIPHWYTSGDVLLYVYQGHAFFTMMNDEGKVYHSIVRPGDVVSIPIGNFHSFLNIGTDDLEVYEAFNRVDQIQEITLLNGAQHLSTGMVEGATGLNADLVNKMKQEKDSDFSYIVPY